ncbi:MAG: hypothetical protein O7A04_09180 [Acidobacteria bacterium]|nr:hypothetical protein [Acidobacteriota bacterium]
MLGKTLSSALALTLLLTLPALAQIIDAQEEGTLPLLSLEEVLENYYDAIGGEEAWLEVESLKMTGTMMMGPGMEAPFTVYSQRPDKQRLEFTFQGMTGVQALDGDDAWMLMPFLGKTEPEAMPEEMAKQMKDQLDIEGALINWASKGHVLEMLGPGEAQGTEAYMIKATLASGTEQLYYLDAEAFVPFMLESSSIMQGQEVETETIFSDFKEVEGLMLAHSIENRPKGQPGGQVITIESIEVGLDLSDIQFAMPAPTAEEEVAE